MQNKKRNKVNEPIEEQMPVIEPEPATEQSSIGLVINCEKLVVRKKPEKDSKILEFLDNSAKVEIDIDNSTHAWFKVCTESGIEGYCMKKFIAVT